MLRITIYVDDEQSARQIWAAGADDLRESFLPEIGIQANRVELAKLPDDPANVHKYDVPVDRSV